MRIAREAGLAVFRQRTKGDRSQLPTWCGLPWFARTLRFFFLSFCLAWMVASALVTAAGGGLDLGARTTSRSWSASLRSASRSLEVSRRTLDAAVSAYRLGALTLRVDFKFEPALWGVTERGARHPLSPPALLKCLAPFLPTARDTGARFFPTGPPAWFVWKPISDANVLEREKQPFQHGEFGENDMLGLGTCFYGVPRVDEEGEECGFSLEEEGLVKELRVVSGRLSATSSLWGVSGRIAGTVGFSSRE